MNSLDAAYERDWEEPTPSLSVFVKEVMDLIDAFLRHQEKKAQISEAAANAFKGQTRIVSGDQDAGHDRANKKTLEYLRSAYNARREETSSRLVSELRTAETTDGHLSVEGFHVAPDMHEVGLAGFDLATKLSGWHGALVDFLRNGGRKALRYALSWANILLGSMAASGVLRPLAEPIKELKDVVHTMI
ncbi:hypothetical protein [Nesterenkonia suensis]